MDAIFCSTSVLFRTMCDSKRRPCSAAEAVLPPGPLWYPAEASKNAASMRTDVLGRPGLASGDPAGILACTYKHTQITHFMSTCGQKQQDQSS